VASLGFQKGGHFPPLFSLPLPSPPIPSLLSSLRLPFPSLPLEEGALNPARGLGGAL